MMAWLILASYTVVCWESRGRVTYSRPELLQLQASNGIMTPPTLLSCVPRELLRLPVKTSYTARPRRKRGRRGGVRQRVRSGGKLPLPPILLCNARSLRRKLDELRTLVKMQTRREQLARLLTVSTNISKQNLMQQCW
ncbi:hypothetical protein WMY93_029936 [Mugilogobius chulae]|uniref:Uncharacterized protein n=1 Tax=Mugilogobius chulae TaxID=88201 RepID=A0AAW0MQV7_9GOBI